MPRSDGTRATFGGARKRALLLMLLMALLSSCTSERPMERHPLIGAWRSSIQVSSGVLAEAKGLEFMYVFHADGTLTESSNYDAAPPVPPAYGIWMSQGAGRIEARYEFFTTARSTADDARAAVGWLPSGRGVITEVIEFETKQSFPKTFRSKLRYELFDNAGKPVPGGGEATGRAARIGS